MKYHDIPAEAVATEKGFKIRTKFNMWKHFVKVSCTQCGTEHFKLKLLKQQKRHFCSNICQTNYNHITRDPKGFNILQNKNDPDFYYLLGLICTDGHISWPGCTKSATSYECFVSLHQKDFELIEKIQEKFGGKAIRQKHIAKWVIRNKQFIDFLKNEVNICNRKSYNLNNIKKWFLQLSDDQKINFVRGCFDGDGWTSAKTCKYKSWTICSVSKKFVELLQEYIKTWYTTQHLEKYVKINGRRYNKNKHMYFITINKKQNMKILAEKLYSTGTLFLQRKYERLIKSINEN